MQRGKKGDLASLILAEELNAAAKCGQLSHSATSGCMGSGTGQEEG